MICHSTRSGRLRKNHSEKCGYFSFVPAKLPPDPAPGCDAGMRDLLCRIHSNVGFLAAVVRDTPEDSPLISHLVLRESIDSLHIEGVHVGFEEVLMSKGAANACSGVCSVLKNAEAIDFAVGHVSELRSRGWQLVRNAHGILFADASGESGTGGQFRTTQNWIGAVGSAPDTASFVPPNPCDMQQAMDDLESFILADAPGLDPFVKAALIHYQFETIHPFRDGNGRIGRLLTTLYLADCGLPAMPWLFLSGFLKRNRAEYYDRLMAVRQDGNYESWIMFFLRALDAAVAESIETIGRYRELHDARCRQITSVASGQSNRRKWLNFLEYLERNPVIGIGTVARDLGTTFPTATKLINRFVDLGILCERTGGRRNRCFVHAELLDMLQTGLATEDGKVV